MTEKDLAEDYRMVLHEAKSMGCNKIKALHNIPLKNMEMIVQALEKQIPKKPNKAIDSSWGVKKEVHVCPVCDYYLTEVHFIAPQKIESNKKITYCETCGQAIDWSDEECNKPEREIECMGYKEKEKEND